MIAVIERSKLAAHLNPEIGQRLRIDQADGQKIPATVIKVSASSVTLDANHPLAGKNLTFDIELLEIV
jgi:FKBP-type peptidyl-prolyl cis-trans isomerase 2